MHCSNKNLSAPIGLNRETGSLSCTTLKEQSWLFRAAKASPVAPAAVPDNSAIEFDENPELTLAGVCSLASMVRIGI